MSFYDGVPIPTNGDNICGYTTNYFLETISPVTWASLGVGAAMGLSGVGAAWYALPLFSVILIVDLHAGVLQLLVVL